MDQLNVIQRVAVWALPILFAITVHEVAHGWMAKRLGDKTAMMLGRLTLNPLKHIDPVGTILVPGVMLLLGGFIFGWAKPVPVTWQNLHNPKRDMALVALAGPVSNLLMATIWAIVMRIGISLGGTFDSAAVPLIYMGSAGVLINVLLAVLNLLPVPPLDGGRVLSSLLPGPWSYKLSLIEPYGLFILVGLLVTGLLGQLIGPPISWLQHLFYTIVGI